MTLPTSVQNEYYLDDQNRNTKIVIKDSGIMGSDVTISQYFNDNGFLTKTVNGSGREKHFYYDGQNAMTAVVYYDAASPITSYRYERSDLNRVTKVTDAEGNVTTYDYSNAGYLLTKTEEVVGGTDLVESWVYNADGQRLTHTDVEGIVAAYEYDSNGYLTRRITDPTGLNIQFTMWVDSVGRVTKRRDARGNDWETYYNSKGKITKGVIPSGQTTELAYDGDLNLTKRQVYDSAGTLTQTTTHTYDQWGRVTRTTLPGSRNTDYEYDFLDRMISEKPPTGEEFFFSYNELGQSYQEKVYDSINNVTITRVTNYYDGDGQLTRQTDANSNDIVKNQEYDSYGRLTRATDALDNYVVPEYDDLGRVTRQVSYDSGDTSVAEFRRIYDQLGRITRMRSLAGPDGSLDTNQDIVADFVYDDTGRVLTRTQHLSGTDGSTTIAETVYTYDNAGRMITQTTSDGPTVAFSYDAGGKMLTRKIDPTSLAITSTFVYDELGRVTRSTNPDSTYAVTLYDGFGNVSLNVAYDSSNNTKAASGSMYDYSLGVVTKSYRISDPASSLAYNSANDPATQYQYSTAGRLTRTVDPNANNSATYDYDDLGRRITITDAVTNKTVYEYDNADRMMTLVRLDYDGANHVTFKSASEFDVANRVTKTIQQGPDGALGGGDDLETIVWFDALGRGTLVQDPKGTQTARLYDALGRVTRKTEDSAGIARYTDYNYDRASRLTRQTGYTSDATGAQNTDYAYNKAGVMTRATYPDDTGGDRGYVTFIYDSALRLITKNDQENQDTIFVRDSMSRPRSVTRGSEIDTFSYTALGQLDTAQRGVSGNPDSVAKSQRYYNGLGRLTREAQAVKETTALTVDYLYYKVGSVTALYYPGGDVTISRTMTANNLANIISRNADQVADYDYVGQRIKTLTYETGNDDVSATRLYDGAARMTRLTWAQTGNTLPDFSYAFDKASNIMTKTHEHRSGDPIEKYDVDGLYRLTDARYDFRAVTHGFDYDDLGNQLTFTEDGSATAGLYNDVNELTSYGGTQAYWDKNGNLTKDVAGGNGPYSYYYDMRNQLSKVTKSGGDVAEYAYDTLGRRVQFIDSVNTVTKQYYHDRGRVIEEYDAAGTPARQRYYVWGNYIDELLVLNDDAGDNSDYYTTYDHLYSPHGLLSKADGAIVERYDYDAYGKPIIYTGNGGDGNWWDGDEVTASVSAKGLPYLFTGREFDPLDGAALKLQYSRARYYSLPLRRWLQRDPLEYVDGMNLYVYVQSNPIRFGDPFGLHNAKGCPEPKKGGFGSVLGGFFGGMIEGIEKLILKKTGDSHWFVDPDHCSLTKVSHRGCIICKKRCKWICKVTVDIKVVFPMETCTLNVSKSGVTVCTIGWVGCVLYIEPHACEDGMCGGKWEPGGKAKRDKFIKCLLRNLVLKLGIMK